MAIKSISVLFDGLLSLLTYLILRRQRAPSLVPLCGAALMLFAPTIVINSAAWGQCDAIYAAFCLGSLYCLLTKRPAWACVCFGIAIAFKLQAIFFLPVLCIPFLRRTFPARYLLLAPAIFLLLLAPTLLAGRSVQGLAQVYVDQVRTGGVTATAGGGGRQGAAAFGTGQPPANGMAGTASSGAAGPGGAPGVAGSGPGGASHSDSGAAGAGSHAQPGPGGSGSGAGSGGGFGFSASTLTYDAPTLYQWFPANAPAFWKWLGTLLAALAAAALVALAFVQRVKLRSDVLLRFALLIALTVPFLLPAMHERYFYLADVLSILFACRFPRYFFVPIAMQAASLLSYAPYLLNIQVGYLPLVSGLVLALIVVVAADLLLALYPACPLPPPLRAMRAYALRERPRARSQRFPGDTADGSAADLSIF